MDPGGNPLQDPLSALEVGYVPGRVTTDGSLEHAASWWLYAVDVVNAVRLARLAWVSLLGSSPLPSPGASFSPIA